jgi:hypothetical protein
MNINNKESFSERYAVISYSHDDAAVVKAEMERFDGRDICYWFDDQMVGGKSYVDEFRGKLDNENCGGCIFFVSESFLLSPNCADEMEYFLKKYSVNNPNKFCFFVLPEHFAMLAGDTNADKPEKFYEIVKDCVRKNQKSESSDDELKKHIELFLKASLNCTSLFGVLGDKNGYIKKYTKEGQTFYNAAIIYGHKRVSEVRFGFFPQDENEGYSEKERFNPFGVEEKKELRHLDKKNAYYAPVEWLVISDTILLSKKLLFAVDYLNLRYPITPSKIPSKETVAAYIKKEFLKYFQENKKDEKPEYKIKNVRFLKEDELSVLLRRANNDPDPTKKLKKRREILLPEATYFAQITNRKNTYAFWLAGDDMEDARRVDSGMERLSEQKAGVELYYVRVVIEVEKV